MNLTVTLGMKQYTVNHSIASAEDPPDDVVAPPPSHPRDLVAAFGTQSALSEPQTEKLIPPSWTCFHLQVKATLEVSFPPDLSHVPFGPSLCLPLDRPQHLRLVTGYDVYQQFTCVDHTTQS